MSTLERRRRVRCRLACELLGTRRTARRSHIVTLSEGGFAIETEPQFETGDEVRLCILPHRRERAVKVTGIVWNEIPSRRRGSSQLVFGCVVSDPPPRFLELLEEVEAREAPRTREVPVRPARSPSRAPREAEPARPAPTPRTRAAEPEARSELPRSREPMPPPKPEPEEGLPRFRVRVKQVGGSRTRSLEVQAPSSTAAAEVAAGALVDSRTRWQVLEVLSVDGPPRRSGG